MRYRCYDYHKRLGPEYVRCYSDGTWSELPTCLGINKSVLKTCHRNPLEKNIVNKLVVSFVQLPTAS